MVILIPLIILVHPLLGGSICLQVHCVDFLERAALVGVGQVRDVDPHSIILSIQLLRQRWLHDFYGVATDFTNSILSLYCVLIQISD